MNRLCSILLLLILCSVVYCQTEPEWEWAHQIGGANTDYGLNITTDSFGNSFITGYFIGTTTVGSTILTSSGSADIFITKLDHNGNFLWSRQAGGCYGDVGYGITTDVNGNCYVTGYFTDIATFGNSTLDSHGSWDIFVSKLDTNGNWVWTIQAGGTDSEAGYSISTDDLGNCYISGLFCNTVSFGETTLNGSSSGRMFVAKLGIEGNFIWARDAGTDGMGASISTDNQGNSYLTGCFSHYAYFGPIVLHGSGVDMFIAKIDTEGNYLWAKCPYANGVGDSIGNGIDIDSNGNCYVTGFFTGTANFDTLHIESYGVTDILVLKIDPNGNYLWVKTGGGTSEDQGCGIAIDNNGNSYVSGYFKDSATLGTTVLTSNGMKDIFFTKLDSDGNFLWTKQCGGINDDMGYDIDIDDIGNCFVTGYFSGVVTFGMDSLTSCGSNDIFIAKLSTEGSLITDEFNLNNSCLSHLVSAYPNPFQSFTNLKVDLSSWVSSNSKPIQNACVNVYNFKGQKVRSIELNSSQKGEQLSYWDGRDANNTRCSSGIYILHLLVNSKQVSSRKVTLLRK